MEEKKVYVLYVDGHYTQEIVARFLYETKKALRTNRVVVLPSTFRLEEVPSRSEKE